MLSERSRECVSNAPRSRGAFCISAQRYDEPIRDLHPGFGLNGVGRYVTMLGLLKPEAPCRLTGACARRLDCGFRASLAWLVYLGDGDGGQLGVGCFLLVQNFR
jgi:hypothetical protein